MSSQTPEQQLETRYKQCMEYFAEIRRLLNISSIKNDMQRPQSWLALVEAAFYKKNRLHINWDKLEQYWAVETTVITDADFAKLQRLYISVRSSCDYIANYILHYCPKDAFFIWGNDENGWSKILNMFIISFPFMVISIYTSEFRDKPLDWTTLLEYGKKGHLYMFDVIVDLSTPDGLEHLFKRPTDTVADEASAKIIQQSLNELPICERMQKLTI